MFRSDGRWGHWRDRMDGQMCQTQPLPTAQAWRAQITKNTLTVKNWKLGILHILQKENFRKIFDETFHPVQYERFWCSNSVDINAYIWIKKTWFFSEMFWRQILTRPVIPITSAVAITYFINDSQFKTVLAKDHEKIKVFGFRGSPDTHALLTYLNWAGISYEFENVNPFKLDNLENLPCSKY